MDAGWIALGVMFILFGIFAASIPELGLLGPGEALDPRIAPLCFVFGLIFFIIGAVSKKGTKSIQQPIQVPSVAISPQVTKAQVVKIKCPRCDHLNDEDAKFCMKCGSPLVGVQIPPPPPTTYSYCPYCGKQLTLDTQNQRPYCANCKKYF